MEIKKNIERVRYELDIKSNSKFALIGNNIDGFVSVGTIIFNNFKHLQSELEKIILSLSFGGEWDVTLYAIPPDFTLLKKWDYYIYPSTATKIKRFSYMDLYCYKIHFNNNTFTIFSHFADVSSDIDDFGISRNTLVQLDYKYEMYKLSFKNIKDN